jgi:DNA polymerase V
MRPTHPSETGTEPRWFGRRPLPLVLTGEARTLPLAVMRVCAGFPSPADDHAEEALDPARLIVANPVASFLWRVEGNSMVDAGVRDGDYVVVDRSLTPKSGDVVVAVIDGLPSLKRVVRRRGRLMLDFANAAMEPLELGEASEAAVWGVVTWSLTRHRVVAG